jgi:glutathione S-transferase
MAIQIIRRSSSHFTRVTRIFGLELGVEHELPPVFEITATDSEVFAGNPALKIPSLKRSGTLLFGAENICRALAELSPSRKHIVWPEQLTSDLSRNAHELLWHSMTAQVQLAIGTIVAKLPADNVFFVKIRAGFEGALRWLEVNLDSALAAMPAGRDLSLFDTALFCLVEHLSFRNTISTEPYPKLKAYAGRFGERDLARRTTYRFDAPPA